jgi:endonuclease-8
MSSDRPRLPSAVPEGHSIHRAARDQKPWLVGKRIQLTAPDGRCQEVASRLNGRELRRIEPVGKHLFYHFVGDEPHIVHVHLALLGNFRHYKGDAPEPRGAVRLRFDSGDHVLDLHAARTAELLDDEAVHAIKARIGPDPLHPKADAEAVWRRIRKSPAPLGTLLMNQAVVSGIGNIYRSELLFRRRVHPRSPGRSLPRETFDELWRDTVDLMKIGVRYGKIITVDRDFAKKQYGKTFSKLKRREQFYVYKQPTCLMTGGPIETFDLANRTVYVSPQWQDLLR